MNISALNTIQSILPSYVNSSTQAAQSDSTQTEKSRRKAMFENIDGDTAQFSIPVDIKGFLDKVKDGTVTDEDVKAMQAKLVEFEKQAQTQLAANANGASRNSEGPDIKAFLDKVKAGTVTAADLNTMKEALSKADSDLANRPNKPPGGPPPGGPPPGGPPPAQSSSSSSSSTDSDYDTLTEELLEALIEAADKKKEEETQSAQSVLATLTAQSNKSNSSTKTV
jgi:hypothetical protein